MGKYPPIFTSALAILSGQASASVVKVLDTSFPDPSVVYTGSDYYAFATGANGVYVQAAHSTDFTTWEYLSGYDPLAIPLPSWVQSPAELWAPDVLKLSTNSYVMYYTAKRASTGVHCLGLAVSSTAKGPYNHISDTPLVCNDAAGGVIDPNGFIDTDGTIYLVYKIDGNTLNSGSTLHPTPIMLQQLDSKGRTVVGSPIQLLDRSDLDGPLIEAPSLMVRDGIYYLSFSSNWYNTEKYDTSYGYATSVRGPWAKQFAPYAPLLVTGTASENNGSLSAPGGSDFSADGTKIVFHANRDGHDINAGRAMFVADITVKDNIIRLA